MRFSSLLNILSRPTLSIQKQLRQIHDLKIGDHVIVKKKITFEDVKNFAVLTGDHNTIHVKSEMPIVHGAFLNGLVSGVIGTKLPGFGTLVCKQQIIFPEPCYVGEEVNNKFFFYVS